MYLMKENKKTCMSSNAVDDFVKDCSNYGLSVTWERLIKLLD
jgi:hypothetical protein